MPDRQERTKISFFGHFGTPNSGNEGTLVAILARLRVLYPDREFCCICTYPEVAVARYGVDAVPISTRSASIWNRQARLDKRLTMALVGLSQEVWQYVRAFRALQGTDMLIIPGTGLLTDAYGLGGWGPYNLFKWSLAAKLRGCRVLFVSVGAGPLHSVPGRWLVKLALSFADYRSYRDSSSMSYLESIGVRTRHDRIYPDLVFSLPQDSIPAPVDRVGRGAVVALGLMENAGWYSAANPGTNVHVGYMESLVVFVQWLLDHDYEVKLVLGDWDAYVVEEFRAMLRERLGTYDERRVTHPRVDSFQELLLHLEAADIVVATRFHNVIFSILLDKPVIAISFHHKCTSLMSDMGLSEYCYEINEIEPDVLIERFQRLVGNAGDVKRTIEQRANERRAALDEQYDLLFDGAGAPSRSGQAAPSAA
jgi:polysaccharide pyruvyl transferase WcaK-like protein